MARRRLLAAIEILPKEAIWVDPDCGLKTRTVDEAIGKMEVVVAATKHLRNSSQISDALQTRSHASRSDEAKSQIMNATAHRCKRLGERR